MRRATQRRGRAVAPLLALLLALSALTNAAHAGVSLQANVTVSAGVTDNVASAATTPVPGTVGRESDFELILAPGLILAGGTPRAVQTVQYTLAGIIYGRHSEADTYTNTLLYQGLYLPTKRTRVGLNLGIAQGQLSAFNIATPSTGQVSQAQLPGQQNILTISANETFAWELARDWLLSQNLGYSTTYNLSPPPFEGVAQSAPATVRIERQFEHSAIAFEGDATFTDFYAQHGPVTLPDGSVNKNGVIVPQQYQMLVTPQLQYRRDLTWWLSARANAGPTFVVDPSDRSDHYITGMGGVGLNFNTGARVNLDISYQHSVAPNLLFRSNFLTDNVTARGLFLISRRYNLSFSTAVTYLYSRELDLTNQPEGHASTILVDATLAYNPIRELIFFLRYQLIDQIAGNTGAGGESTSIFPLTTYYRNTLLFGLTATYPAETAVQVQGNTMGVRADHSDDARIEVSKSSTP